MFAKLPSIRYPYQFIPSFTQPCIICYIYNKYVSIYFLNMLDTMS